MHDEFLEELLAAKGKENNCNVRQQLKWELCEFSVQITKQAMPPAAFEPLRKLADEHDQEQFDRFLETQVGNIAAFRRDIDRQFREEYLKPTYQLLRH
jgi:hypothetical protein